MVVFLDTETTGLYPGEICQLSYVMQDGEKVTAKNFFFNVEFVEYGAYKVHGFSVEDLERLSGGKFFLHHIEEIGKDLCGADMLVSHNTAFDFMFLRREFDRANADFTFNGEFCSMKGSVEICKLPRCNGIGYKYPKLTELCSHFNVSDGEILAATKKLFGVNIGFHDARFDTTAVYLAINKGITMGYYEKVSPYLKK